MDYIEFKPSRLEQNKKSRQDKYYIFNKNNLLVKKSDYSLPDRAYVEERLELEGLDCLGSYREENCYLANMEGDYCRDGYEFIGLREFMEKAPDKMQFKIASRASLINGFKDRHGNCGYCGGETRLIDHHEDRALKCVDCGMHTWPTASPAIIVAVTKEDKLLMASNLSWQDNRYSVIAGFVEMGESFEDAVKREVLEETGIRVKEIEYFASQPWPFPNSMMIGFTAKYMDGDIVIQEEELSDVKWFTKSEIPGKFNDSRSIGSGLIKWFLNEYEYKK